MTINFQRPAEAVAAITWVICTADNKGTVQERNFIYEKVRAMDLFSGMSIGHFSSLLGATRTKLFNTLPNDGFCLHAKSVNSVIRSASRILAPQDRQQVYQMATDLAESDYLDDSELPILSKIKHHFRIDQI